MLSARPGPLNPGAVYLLQHHPMRPSRAAGSFFGPKPTSHPSPEQRRWLRSPSPGRLPFRCPLEALEFARG